MIRTVVSFERMGEQTLIKLEDAPADIVGMRENALADVSPLDGGDVMTRGAALLGRLNAHAPIRLGLEMALARPAGTEPAPLYFRSYTQAADELPWEEIYTPLNGFCALDARWPIGRLARRPRQMRERTFSPPLHVVAVLAAAGRSGVAQLKALAAAAGTADAAAIGVTLHVISGDQAVLDAAGSLGQANVTAEVLAGTAPQVAKQITDARPHILHLLCHGAEVAGVRVLAMATMADVDAGEEIGSVRLKVADLTVALESCDPWLVVLGACETAASTLGPALSLELADAGIPAVIGMRRLVDLGSANVFCAALYPEVLSAIKAAVDPAATPGLKTIEWATTLTGPRSSMSGPDPSQSDSWSDPVVYCQDDPLAVRLLEAGVSPADFLSLRGQLDVWEGYEARLDPLTTKPEVLAEVQARVQELRARLGEDQ